MGSDHPLLGAEVLAAIERAATGAPVFTAYRDIAPIDQGFAERRELWRLPAYLAVVAVDGSGLFGRRYLDRVSGAIRLYR